MSNVYHLSSSRPKYESTWSLRVEDNARLYLEQLTGYRIDKLAEGQWQVDWAMYENGVCKYFAEFRRRFNNHDQYNDLSISASKITKLKHLSKEYGLEHSLLIVQFNDRLVRIAIGEHYETRQLVPFGRTNGRDNKDTDPSIRIYKEKFVTIHYGRVSDDLSDRPRGDGSTSLIEGIRAYGVDELRRLEQQKRVQRVQ